MAEVHSFFFWIVCAFEGGKLEQDIGNVASLHLNFEA